MPGGIGKVSDKALTAGAMRRRRIAAGDGANDIFYHLDAHHVCLDRSAGQLYFVDTPQGLIAATVGDVLAGMGAAAVIEQLYLDRHRLFCGARRVALTARQADAVLIALRLVGVAASIR